MKIGPARAREIVAGGISHGEYHGISAEEDAEIRALWAARGHGSYNDVVRDLANPPDRCIAPEDVNGDLGDGRHLCGAPATTTRTIAGLVCALCERHALEVDRDFAPRPRLMGWDDDGGYENPNDEES